MVQDSAGRLSEGRPRHFPSIFAWLSVGIGRSWRGTVGALVATWLNVPFALLTAALAALLLGPIGFLTGQLGGHFDVVGPLAGLPVLGPALDALSPGSIGVITGILFTVLGLVAGFVGGLALFWELVSGGNPVAGVIWLASGAAVGLLYTLYRMVFESAILQAAGARRMSRRERALILPVVQASTRMLGLPNHPPILVQESLERHAVAHTRHIVVSRGLLEDFHYDPEVIGGVVSHALVHWRNGDAISAAFIRGIALPLYLVYAGVGWLARRRHGTLATSIVGAVLAVLGWLVFWPVMVTVRYLVIPLQAADARRAEFRADQGAVLAGYREGLRRVVARLDGSFEGGHNGWTRAVSDSHPPAELRLERLEEPGRTYPLPDPDREPEQDGDRPDGQAAPPPMPADDPARGSGRGTPQQRAAAPG